MLSAALSRRRLVEVRLSREIRGELADGGRVEGRHERRHEEIGALSRLILLDRLLEIGEVLAREVRPLRRRGDAGFAVALEARRGLALALVDLERRCARLARLGLALERGEIGRDVGDVLIRE